MSIRSCSGRTNFTPSLWALVIGSGIASLISGRKQRNIPCLRVGTSRKFCDFSVWVGVLICISLLSWFSNDCLWKLNVPLPPVLAYFPSEMVAHTDLCETIWQVADCAFSVSVFFSSLTLGVWPWMFLLFFWQIDVTLRSQGASSVIFPCLSPVSRLFYDEASMQLLDKQFFDP